MSTTAETITIALTAGYRLIDTAQGYENEEGVGEALRRSELPHDEVFINTKLANSKHGTDMAMRAFEESLRKLGLDEVDLFLLHWPVPARDLYVQTWQTLEKIHAGGRVRSIGVSNFTENHLNRLIRETEVVPAVNQVELHPRFPQQALRAYDAEHSILTEAWKPDRPELRSPGGPDDHPPGGSETKVASAGGAALAHATRKHHHPPNL
jgi:diketogulonate reductase-like aldo/keto reductase